MSNALGGATTNAPGRWKVALVRARALHQGQHHYGYLLVPNEPPARVPVTIHLKPRGQVNCELQFTSELWEKRRVFGMPLELVVYRTPSPIPAVVSLLINEIDARSTRRTGSCFHGSYCEACG